MNESCALTTVSCRWVKDQIIRIKATVALPIPSAATPVVADAVVVATAGVAVVDARAVLLRLRM